MIQEKKTMKSLFCIAALILALVLPARADFSSAMNAFDRQDYAEAYKQFATLADHGDDDSMYMLGYLYTEGKGVRQDYIQAHKWFNLAAAGGVGEALASRNHVESRMTAAQVAKAQQLARDWKPRQSKPTFTAPTFQGRDKHSNGHRIVRIQRRLAKLGYNPGPADGKTGHKTNNAIRNYQYDYGLRVDGKPSEHLLKHLEKNTRTVKTAKSAAGTETTTDKTNYALTNDLRDLIERGRQRRAAHDWFLTDLAALVDRYDRPWRRELIWDDFRDGNFKTNPTWSVISGQFWIDAQYGLRTAKMIENRPQRQTDVHDDIAADLLNRFLEQTINEISGDSMQRQRGPAEIYSVKNIGNAFAVKLLITVFSDAGALELGPYEKSQRDTGYRLMLSPSRPARINLLCATSRGKNVIESSSQNMKLTTGRQYTLLWTRDHDGKMVVSLDNKNLFHTVDRSLKQPFKGFVIRNLGGEYGIREISVHGMKNTPAPRKTVNTGTQIKTEFAW